MITIQRGETKLKVSKGAFDLYYKGIGFKVVGVKAEKSVEKTEEASKSEDKEEAPKTPKNENPKKVGDK